MSWLEKMNVLIIKSAPKKLLTMSLLLKCSGGLMRSTSCFIVSMFFSMAVFAISTARFSVQFVQALAQQALSAAVLLARSPAGFESQRLRRAKVLPVLAGFAEQAEQSV
jgi:hypothetical protein